MMNSTTERDTVKEAEEILGLYFPVLDHGFISLVDYMGSDQAIEQAARVSYGHGTRSRTKTRGLLRYLMRHRHTTPFEMVELKFHAAMPMFVARQWVRHRTANLNEYSGRYSLMPMLFYTPEKEHFAPQSKSNRQGREEGAFSEPAWSSAKGRWAAGREFAQETYEALTAQDVARELARIDLPLSTYTQWYWKIDLHNLFHFLSLRCDEHAQFEIRQYANVMAGMVKRVCPLAFEAWVDYDFHGAHLSRAERELLSALVQHEKTDADGELVGTGFRHDWNDYDLSSREIDEFLDKTWVPMPEDFDLDLDEAKPPRYFEEQMAEAVPEVDQ